MLKFMVMSLVVASLAWLRPRFLLKMMVRRDSRAGECCDTSTRTRMAA